MRLALILLLAGCHSATITRTDGSTVDGVIVGGTPDAINVEVWQGDVTRENPILVVPRADVVEVDHPGALKLGFGGVVLGLGVLGLGITGLVVLVADDDAPKGEVAAFGLINGGITAGGIALLYQGFADESASMRRMEGQGRAFVPKVSFAW